MFSTRPGSPGFPHRGKAITLADGQTVTSGATCESLARRRISGLLEPLLVGFGPITIAVSVLLIQPIQWYEIVIGAFLCLFSAIWIFVGVKGWLPRGALG